MTKEVNSPAHYTQGGIECIDAIEAQLTKQEFIGFLRGQIAKYNWRMGLKGSVLVDAQKCQWYCNKLNTVLTNEQPVQVQPLSKYKLTEETKQHGETTLYRIQALRDIPSMGVKAGDLGGWVAGEHNLSQEGDAWVYKNAKVYRNAKVCGNAVVYENAQVYGYAVVYGNAKVYENAVVYGYAKVCDDAVVYGNAQVYGYAKVCDDAVVYGYAQVCDAVVYGDAKVCGNAVVYGDAKVCDDAWVYKNAKVYRNAKV